jgi:cytochrome P450
MLQLFEETIAVLGDREPTYDDYERLSYAQCVFKETLRLYPPVVGLAKMASQDITLPGGYHVPKGVR